MSYSDVANRMISETNFTQKEISDKCKELGEIISREQLNKILNGKAPAPKEKVSRTIAKICNADDRELVIEGYLEKAPKEFIEFLNIFQEACLNMGLQFMENKLTDEEISIIRDLYKKETLAKIIVETLDMDCTQSLNMDNVEIDKAFNIIFENNNYIQMEDDSMENKIPKGSKLRIKIKEKYKNGDIVLVKVRNDKKPIIRIVFFIGRDVCLGALNKKYNSLYLKNGDFKIIAEINSVETEV